MKNNDNGTKKYQLLNAQIFNIIAFVIPAVFSLNDFIRGFQKYQKYGSGDLPMTGSAVEEAGIIDYIRYYFDKWENIQILIALAIGTLVFILGIIIYFHDSPQAKIKLSYTYLILAIIALAIAVTSMPTDAIFFFWWTLAIPGIFQIIAGTKFISGSIQLSKQ